MREIQARKNSTGSEPPRLNRRLGMSLPNLGEERSIAYFRQTSLAIPESVERGSIHTHTGTVYAVNTHTHISPTNLAQQCLVQPHTHMSKHAHPVDIHTHCTFYTHTHAHTNTHTHTHTNPPSHSLPGLVQNIPSKPIKQLKLPDFPHPLVYHYVQNYYSEMILLLGKAIFCVPPENSTLLARLLYLRGFINTLCSRYLDDLSDFQNLYTVGLGMGPGCQTVGLGKE